MTSPDRPFDAGLQPERTLLAWQRTGLALALAGVVIVRLTVGELGPASLVVGIAGLLLAGAVAVIAHRRYRAAHRQLHSDGTLPQDGLLVALLSLSALLVGLSAAAYVVAGGL